MNWSINKNFLRIALLSAAVAGTLNPRSYNKNRFWDQKQDYGLQTDDKGKCSNFISFRSSKFQFNFIMFENIYLESALCFTTSFYHDQC